MLLGEARKNGRIYESIHYCPTCWVVNANELKLSSEEVELRNPALLHGWKSVRFNIKAELMLLTKPVEPKEDNVPTEIEEFEYEYDGFEDKFLNQSN